MCVCVFVVWHILNSGYELVRLGHMPVFSSELCYMFLKLSHFTDHWAQGGAGASDLGLAVIEACRGARERGSPFK